jgi:hypothetical protein
VDYSLKNKNDRPYSQLFSVLWSPQNTAVRHPRNAGGVEVKAFLSKRRGLASGD